MNNDRIPGIPQGYVCSDLASTWAKSSVKLNLPPDEKHAHEMELGMFAMVVAVERSRMSYSSHESTEDLIDQLETLVLNKDLDLDYFRKLIGTYDYGEEMQVAIAEAIKNENIDQLTKNINKDLLVKTLDQVEKLKKAQ